LTWISRVLAVEADRHQVVPLQVTGEESTGDPHAVQGSGDIVFAGTPGQITSDVIAYGHSHSLPMRPTKPSIVLPATASIRAHAEQEFRRYTDAASWLAYKS
jgi:hypothetical protein